MKKTRVFVALMTVGTFLLASCGDKKEEASGEAGDKKEEASGEAGDRIRKSWRLRPSRRR